jgi:DNA-binding response OmpR family regulator
LIVDDEYHIRFVLERTLQHEGYHPNSAANGEEALEKLALSSPPYDLLLLDLQMGQVSGLQVLEAAREQDPDIVVLILTAYGSLDSAVEALRLGAFDYLFKPAMPEAICRRINEGLQVRQRSLQRRRLVNQVDTLRQTLDEIGSNHNESTTPDMNRRIIRSGSLVIDRHHRHVTLDNNLIDLTTAEFDLLLCLVAAAPQPLSPRQLVNRALGYDCEYREASEAMKWHIYRLRRKVEVDPAHPCYIKNIRHQGYFWSNDDK